MTRGESRDTREAEMQGQVLELVRASRSFGATRAVVGLDVDLAPGRIHAIVGENGAGKSTALRMLAGELAPDEGEIRIGEERLWPATPEEAIKRGVGLVHQHFMLVESFTALENLVLGAEPVRAVGLDMGRAARAAEELARRSGLHLDFARRTGDLAVGERQRLEILKVLYRDARALLLDEPSAVLAPVEVGELYAALRRLADDGATVAVVTHRLDEVARYADDVIVMRKGRLVARERVRERDHVGDLVPKLTRAIMGRAPLPPPARPPRPTDERVPALELRGVELADATGRLRLDGLTLIVAPGEVVGIAGVEGNGQRELARVCAGLERPRRGDILLAGRPAFRRGTSSALVRAARRAGLVVVHEDRQRDELCLDATVGDNLVLGDLGSVDEGRAVARRLARFGIEPDDPRVAVGSLSGGNQQKVVLARALDRPLVALVVAQPTRGVDVGAAHRIHAAIAEAALAGAGVLCISADLGELRTLCHRLLVLHRGRISAELPPDATDEIVGRAMLGVVAA